MWRLSDFHVSFFFTKMKQLDSKQQKLQVIRRIGWKKWQDPLLPEETKKKYVDQVKQKPVQKSRRDSSTGKFVSAKGGTPETPVHLETEASTPVKKSRDQLLVAFADACAEVPAEILTPPKTRHPLQPGPKQGKITTPKQLVLCCRKAICFPNGRSVGFFVIGPLAFPADPNQLSIFVDGSGLPPTMYKSLFVCLLFVFCIFVFLFVFCLMFFFIFVCCLHDMALSYMAWHDIVLGIHDRSGATLLAICLHLAFVIPGPSKDE